LFQLLERFFLCVKTRREKTPKIATDHEPRGFENPLEQLFDSAYFLIMRIELKNEAVKALERFNELS